MKVQGPWHVESERENAPCLPQVVRPQQWNGIEPRPSHMARKKKPGSPKAPIMRKAKVHANEDLRAYDRKQTREEERKAREEKTKEE
ncbi:MAG: hypothetical protein ACHQ50_01515 [Fimbriimonadales bacterium]